jgi:hypothetical protein
MAMPNSAVSEDELVGAWQLESYVGVDEEGRTCDGPLGSAPRGLLIYGADRHMSVSMMRTDHGPSHDAGPITRFMGYAGMWRLAGTRVVHDVTVSSHSHMVGTRQLRDLVLGGDVLTLSGTAFVAANRPQRRVLTWRRADGDMP